VGRKKKRKKQKHLAKKKHDLQTEPFSLSPHKNEKSIIMLPQLMYRRERKTQPQRAYSFGY